MLTHRQAAAARAIEDLAAELGRAPSQGELAKRLCLHRSAGARIATQLRDRGWLAVSRCGLVLARPAPRDPDPAFEVTGAGRAAMVEFEAQTGARRGGDDGGNAE